MSQMNLFSVAEPVVSFAFHHNARRQNDEDAVIQEAISILERRLKGRRLNDEELIRPEDAKNFVRLKLAGLEYEVFACVLLDNRHRVIHYEEVFRGTIDAASVYPREIVKLALSHNAAAMVAVHNHPSGVTNASRADEHLTRRLKEALALIDVRLLDHFVVGEGEPYSFAERGLL